jgi:menaquinone-dependent protoporphyrinogen oxidase
MKTAIIFTTTHGTAEIVASKIATKLGENQCDLFNLKNTSNVDISSYDTIILGGSIHAGTIQSKMRTFLEKNRTLILEKRVAIYLCSMIEADFEKQLNNAFSEELRKHAICVVGVGGAYFFDKMNFIERFMVKKISGISESTSKIQEDKIDELVFALKK